MNERAKIKQDRKESTVPMRSLLNDLSEDIRRYEEYQIPANVVYQEAVENLLNTLIKDSLKNLPYVILFENSFKFVLDIEVLLEANICDYLEIVTISAK